MGDDTLDVDLHGIAVAEFEKEEKKTQHAMEAVLDNDVQRVASILSSHSQGAGEVTLTGLDGETILVTTSTSETGKTLTAKLVAKVGAKVNIYRGDGTMIEQGEALTAQGICDGAQLVFVARAGPSQEEKEAALAEIKKYEECESWEGLWATGSTNYPKFLKCIDDMSEELKCDREVMVAALQMHTAALQHASEELTGDRDFVLDLYHWFCEQISCSPRLRIALQYTPEEFQNDREFMFAALELNPYASDYASEELKGDSEFMLAAMRVQQYKGTQSVMEHTSEELNGNKDFMLL